MVEKVHVPLRDRSYDIHIGGGLLDEAGERIEPLLPRPSVWIVTDDNVSSLHVPALTKSLESRGISSKLLVLPSGEATKSWEMLQRTVEWLLTEKVERDDLVIAFGGGVIGDLVGFAAAILRRGVEFIQIPTSLLAQVDSSVGGKTGINSASGKNLIGAFHQPRMVLADTDVLQTLTNRDFLAGYGEVAKYGLLGDEKFFSWLEENGVALRDGDDSARAYAVKRACEMKADIVAKDEKERGDRALLNLGHTFGHALEAATGYSDRLLHGEGVAVGCALAFETSQRLGLCSQEAPSRVRSHLVEMGMKVDLADIPGELPDAHGLIELMYQDKKVRSGELVFILAREIGDAFVARGIDTEVIASVLDDGLRARKTS